MTDAWWFGCLVGLVVGGCAGLLLAALLGAAGAAAREEEMRDFLAARQRERVRPEEVNHG